MERFCIITNVEKDGDFETTDRIKDYLNTHHKECVVAVNENSDLLRNRGCIDPSDIPEDIDCAIVLGGDGTMILAAIDLLDKNIPIIGINLGTLGFLTETEKQNIFPTLDALFEDNYTIENRMMVEGNVLCTNHSVYHSYALNDIVITKRKPSGLISVKLYVNDELVNTYLGDGVIISTPTGSTGYNLSAGGPIVTPNTKIMTITPICPHSLNMRSIVVSSVDKIVVEIGKRNKLMEEAFVSFDGRKGIEVQTGDKIEISRSNKETKLVKVRNKSFFNILRTKLGENKE